MRFIRTTTDSFAHKMGADLNLDERGFSTKSIAMNSEGFFVAEPFVLKKGEKEIAPT